MEGKEDKKNVKSKILNNIKIVCFFYKFSCINFRHVIKRSLKFYRHCAFIYKKYEITSTGYFFMIGKQK